MSVGMLSVTEQPLKKVAQAAVRALDRRELNQVWLISQEAHKIGSENQVRVVFLETFIEEALRSEAEENFDRVQRLLDALCDQVLSTMLSTLIVEAFVAAGIEASHLHRYPFPWITYITKG